MRFEVWFPVFTLILGQALIIIAKWLETRWQRKATKKDRERTALIELQDAIAALLHNTWEMYDLGRIGMPIPAELKTEHVTGRDHIARLTTRVSDDEVRARVKAVQDAIQAVVQKLVPPVVAEHNDRFDARTAIALLQLDEPAEAAYNRIGTLIRKE